MSASFSFMVSTPWPFSAEIMNVSSNGHRALIACVSSSSFSTSVVSILLSTSALCCFTSRRRSTISFVSSSSPLRASISRHTTSASPAPPHAETTIARSSLRLGRKMPGVSTKMICASRWIAMPRTCERVVCTLRDTMETFAPTSALSSVDLPALGAPMSATKPQRV